MSDETRKLPWAGYQAAPSRSAMQPGPMDTLCGDMLTLGVEDEAVCGEPPGHTGDHLVTWTTNGPDRVEAEIRWRPAR